MKQQLFQKTTLRLTGVYLSILILLSSVFSLALYRVSITDLDRNYDRAVDFAHRFNGFQLFPEQQDDYLADRKKEQDEGHRHLIDQLLVLNAVILLSGGAFSYALARRTLEPIEEAHMALERFTADASHELRTPLATMQTEIEVSLMNPSLSSKQSRNLLISNLEEVGRLSTLSDRLLTLARLDEDKLPREKVEVKSLIQQSLDAAQARAAAQGIVLKSKVTALNDQQISGDSASLCEALIILLDNAIKYSDKGKTVMVEASVRHKSVHIAVKDKGSGISAGDIPRIFERFYRADQSRTKNAQHGHGLGLALASKIVTLHGGRIDVESTPSKGSTFTASLPLA